jgi:hypothetical protein
MIRTSELIHGQTKKPAIIVTGFDFDIMRHEMERRSDGYWWNGHPIIIRPEILAAPHKGQRAPFVTTLVQAVQPQLDQWFGTVRRSFRQARARRYKRS